MSGDIKQIKAQFQKLEWQQNRLFDLISSLPEKSYFRQPSPDSWSIAQATNHLYLSEKGSLAYLQKKINYPETIPGFHFKSWGAVMALKFSFFSPFRFKAPPAINMWADQPLLSPTEIIEEWKASRIALYAFINQYHAQLGSSLVYKHPIVGRLTMYQMLIFFNDHMHRHLKQIKRIRKQIEMD